MAANEELVEAVAHAFHLRRAPFSSAWAENVDRIQAGIALSVPALRDALARDAQVRGLKGRWPNEDVSITCWVRDGFESYRWTASTERGDGPLDVDTYGNALSFADCVAAIDAVLHPEVASMLRDGKGFDDSDIMPGSEFDGPVVL